MKLLVVRGDLRTHTGYSKHLRAVVELLEPHFDRIYGVDLHYSPIKSVVPFPYPIVHDHQLSRFSNAGEKTTTILHFTSPDRFVPFADSYNIGYFPWETDRFRPDFFWAQAISAMEEMWVPNQFVANLVKRYQYGGPVRIVSWPHDFSAPVPATDDRISAEYGESAGRFVTKSLPSLRSEFSPIFLSITTDVARKGLPILFSEWCDYLADRNKRSLLVLKISSVNVSKTVDELRNDILNTLAPFSRADVRDLDIAFIFGSLSESQLASLYANSDAFVTATMGEGFGGPLLESLLNNTPYIAPRHTSLAELIPPVYPFILESEPAAVILRDNLPVYSLSSTWNIVSRGAISRALKQYETISPVERDALVSQARSYAAGLCGREAVRDAVAQACSRARERADRQGKAAIACSV